MSREEAQVEQPLSTSMAQLAAGTRTLSRIPYLSSFVSPLSWALASASKVAASFGYSKPIYTTTPTPVVIRYQDNGDLIDGPDVSITTGASLLNEVARVPRFPGATHDEMTFDYLLTKPFCISNFKVSTSDAIGATPLVKYGALVGPSYFYYSSRNNTTPIFRAHNTMESAAVVAPSPVTYLHNVFQLWRGGFRFTLKVGKTPFHRTRLLLGFQPYSEIDPETVPSDPNSVPFWDTTKLSGHNVIWDINVQDTCTLDVPYNHHLRYLPVNAFMGSLFVAVMDQLRITTDVSATIDFAVYVECLPGFEFAHPVNPVLPPAPPGTAVPLADYSL